ncbi:hypothetical protein PpBr36_00865 [Pyricularia pennisetigena]|uniref:hypothetical protein n=1 Tax=Pyricularia pennisetigena TaxID=1578925 RepID=UPI0011548CFF|nr:hypothetical protein PpBr36_00865 [Pyricularia pennisetigena]TLS28516.1 hypothetical protein PpBr36_00865 [Pyricularia pennisetigena]
MTDRKTWVYEETWLVDFATKLFPFFFVVFFFLFPPLSPPSSDLTNYPNATLGRIIAILPIPRRNRQVTDRISTIPAFYPRWLDDRAWNSGPISWTGVFKPLAQKGARPQRTTSELLEGESWRSGFSGLAGFAFSSDSGYTRASEGGCDHYYFCDFSGPVWAPACSKVLLGIATCYTGKKKRTHWYPNPIDTSQSVQRLNSRCSIGSN